jgi:hypothetical protein
MKIRQRSYGLYRKNVNSISNQFFIDTMIKFFLRREYLCGAHCYAPLHFYLLLLFLKALVSTPVVEEIRSHTVANVTINVPVILNTLTCSNE